MKQFLITNIQRFSLLDGPGIRTTVFFKGCSVHCPWCSNPENINFEIESYTKDGVEGAYGDYYSDEQLYNEIIKDKDYYGTDGGVTFSGGEPLLFLHDLSDLLKKLNEDTISVAVETGLFVPGENLSSTLEYIDYFYVDMKIMKSDLCKQIIGGDLELYRENLSTVMNSLKKVVIRIPFISGCTDDDNNISQIIKELSLYNNREFEIELLKYHNLGKSKYISLGLDEPRFCEVDNERLYSVKERIESCLNKKTTVCMI